MLISLRSAILRSLLVKPYFIHLTRRRRRSNFGREIRQLLLIWSMALSRIWAAFILISIVVAAVRYVCVPADKEIFSQMVTGKLGDTIRVVTAAPQAPGYKLQKADGIIGTCSYSVTLAIGLIGIMALFMGLVSIAEAAGGMRFLARITGPFFSKLFPDVPKGHPAMGHMVMNFSANLLGLDNAATPFALKAMESLQEINPDKTTASNAQIMFLCLHQSGLQLIPVSVIALRAAAGVADPTDVFVPIVIATFLTTVASMSVVAVRQRINLFQPAILVWIGTLSVAIGALVVYLRKLDSDGVQSFSRAFSSG